MEKKYSRYHYTITAEKKIGRKLNREKKPKEYATEELIHHIDLNRFNNAPENLAVMPRYQHLEAHKVVRILMRDFFQSLFKCNIIIFDEKINNYKINKEKIKKNKIKIILDVGIKNADY